MNTLEIEMGLETIREARKQWAKAQTEYRENEAFALRRLFYEAAAKYMSAEYVSKHSGLPLARVRALMRQFGLNPKDRKALLAESASKALLENAELMGKMPHEMDLSSPLAYLPMGKHMRDQIVEARVARVTELEDAPVTTGLWCRECKMFEPDAEYWLGCCIACGCVEIAHVTASVTLA